LSVVTRTLDAAIETHRRVARTRGLRTIALTGRDGGKAGRLFDIHQRAGRVHGARAGSPHHADPRDLRDCGNGVTSAY
jgi:phosphoheptose isomerase